MERTALEAPASSDKLARQEPRNKDRKVDLASRVSSIVRSGIGVMSDQRYVTCRCPGGSGQSGWSYSKDDLFCPGCGAQVARLVSDNQYPPDSGSGTLWVYPVPGGGDVCFDVPLYLEYADSQRCIWRRPPRMDLEHTHPADARYFRSCGIVPDPSPEDPSASSRPLILHLNPQELEGGRLPKEGVEYRLLGLTGDFCERELVFRVGNTPSVRIELVGDSIEPEPQSGGFVVTVSEKLDVKLLIHAIDAPIIVRSQVNRHLLRCRLNNDGGAADTTHVQFDLKESLEAGTIIYPGKPPWSGDAQFDTSSLIEGQQVTLIVPIYAHVARIDRKDWKVEITRIDKGGLEVRPNPLVIPVMFFGECRSNAMNNRAENPEGPDATGDPPVIRRVFVRNCGKTNVILDDITSLPRANWLTAAWSTDVAEGSKRPRSETQIELAPDERGEIYVRIDLRTITSEDLNADGSLSATLQFKESQNPVPHEVKLVVSKVRPKELCPFALCVDFGNTSSFAAIRNPNPGGVETPWLRDEVIAVHDLSTPERFPTALFFDHVAEDPLAASYEIGTLATAEAEKHGSLVTDLKRWIGSADHCKTVMSPHGDHQAYNVPILIVMFLRRVIQRAEAILRKYTIQQICVSHPSKYTLKRREAFFAVIDQLCETVTRERGIELKRHVFSDVGDTVSACRGIDEANSVAVGAVFDKDVQDWLRGIVSLERPYFTVASFDLGGGSLDTALIRFEVRKGQMDAPRYETEYLGIGGHDGFGGDQVTFVVFELLRQRIREALQKAGLPADSCMSCIPSPLRKDSADAELRQNYDVLWRVSEKVKIHQCTHPGGAAENSDLQGLKHFVRTQLVHDLILDSKPGGRLKPDPKCQEVLKTLADSGEYLIPLDKIYDHPMETDLLGSTEKWTVRERILQCIEEILEFTKSKNVAIDLVVRCGAGSRLPLVEELLMKHLATSKIVPEKSVADSKFLVAHGLVRFLDAATARHSFAMSSDYTSSAFVIGTLDTVRTGRIRLIPNCAPVNAPDSWYFPTSVSVDSEGNTVERRLTLGDLNLYAKEVTVFRLDPGRIPVLHGWFDLTRGPDVTNGGSGTPLSDKLIDTLDPQAAVHLVGSERDIELKVETDSGCLGIWNIILIDETPNEILQ